MTPRCDACGERCAVVTATPTGDLCDACLGEQFEVLVEELDDAQPRGGAA